MREDKFKIVILIKELIVNVDKNLVNFPKKEIELKQEIRRCSYDLLFLAQEGNITSDLSRRVVLIEKSIAEVKQLDFFINMCCDKQIINSKKYYKFGESLDRIIRYLVGWLNSTKSSNNRA